MSERKAVPDSELPATGDQRLRPSAFKGHPFNFRFLPWNDTPSCVGGWTKNMYGKQAREIRLTSRGFPTPGTLP